MVVNIPLEQFILQSVKVSSRLEFSDCSADTICKLVLTRVGGDVSAYIIL